MSRFKVPALACVSGMLLALVSAASPAQAVTGSTVWNTGKYNIRADTNSDGKWDRWIYPKKGQQGVDSFYLPAGTCIIWRDKWNGKNIHLAGSMKHAVTAKIGTGYDKRAEAYYCNQIRA